MSFSLNLQNHFEKFKNSFDQTDLIEDDFVRKVRKSIENIEDIFKDQSDESITNVSETPPYEIVTAKMVMKRNHKGETPLHLACKKGDLNKVKELVKEGVDINMTDFANWAPIHEAIQKERIDCIEYLFTNGALPNVPGENYATPLHKAIYLNKMNVAQILIKYGADLNAVDYTGIKPLDKIQSLDLKRDYEITPKIFVSTETVVYSAYELSKNEKFDLTKAKARIVTKTEFLMRDDVTHYVIGENPNKLDFNILICLLKGIFIVDQNWVLKYTENPDKISFDSILKSYENPNRSSVINRLLKNPPLFDGLNFYVTRFSGKKKVMNLELSKEDLIVLIQKGGGKVLNRPPIVKDVQQRTLFYPFHAANTSLVTCDNYVIYHESEKPSLTYNMQELKHRSSSWLVECILNFKIIDD